MKLYHRYFRIVIVTHHQLRCILKNVDLVYNHGVKATPLKRHNLVWLRECFGLLHRPTQLSEKLIVFSVSLLNRQQQFRTVMGGIADCVKPLEVGVGGVTKHHCYFIKSSQPLFEREFINISER